MLEVEVKLDQVLQALDQLNPAELAEVERRLAARKRSFTPLTDAADLFELPFADYLALSDEERNALAQRAYQTLEYWIEAELAKHKAAWMLVCGGEVIESSPTLHNYPSGGYLMQIGQERRLIPWVFIRAPLIEEAALN